MTRLLCWVGLHRWSGWRVLRDSPYLQRQLEAQTQRRSCTRRWCRGRTIQTRILR
jgi:hypothetical protein